jgi:hypothetical protein
MSNRSWFFAANGQQQGPYQEDQFRDLIARGTVTSQTLVWSEGMAGWQRAGDVPGLLASAGAAGAGAPPPMVSQPGGPVTGGGGFGGGSGALSIDFGIWEFVWRGLVLWLGLLFIIPTPWVIRWYTNWFVSCVRVPGRPNLSFTGKVGTIALWYFMPLVVVILLEVIASSTNAKAIGNIGNFVVSAMYWAFLRYLVANISSNGQPLGLSFSGSYWGYLGYNLLLGLSIFTVIGWAWVQTAFGRWGCRNIQGTRRAVVFKATGLEYLWRTIVLLLACMFIIPIPWVMRWMIRWQFSQTELVDRGGYAAAF